MTEETDLLNYLQNESCNLSIDSEEQIMYIRYSDFHVQNLDLFKIMDILKSLEAESCNLHKDGHDLFIEIKGWS